MTTPNLRGTTFAPPVAPLIGSGSRDAYERSQSLLRENHLPKSDIYDICWSRHPHRYVCYRQLTSHDTWEFRLIDMHDASANRTAFNHARVAALLLADVSRLPLDKVVAVNEHIFRLFRGNIIHSLNINGSDDDYRLSVECNYTPLLYAVIRSSDQAAFLNGQITFVNHSDRLVNVFYIDAQGNRILQNAMRAAVGDDVCVYTVRSFIGHVFSLNDTIGYCIGSYICQTYRQTIAITAEDTAHIKTLLCCPATSQVSPERLDIEFTNMTRQKIKVMWLLSPTDLREVDNLVAGERRTHTSTTGHAFAFFDELWNYVGKHEVGSTPGAVVRIGLDMLLPNTLPTRRDGAVCAVTFRNSTACRVFYTWINHRGALADNHSEIQPFGTRTVTSHVGHMFIIKDAAGHTMLYHEAGSANDHDVCIQDTMWAPDGRKYLFIRNGNVFLQQESAESPAIQLSDDGHHCVYSLENLLWSPDSTAVCVGRILRSIVYPNDSNYKRMQRLNYCPVENSTVSTELNSQFYPRAGDDNSDGAVWPAVFRFTTDAAGVTNVERIILQNLFLNSEHRGHFNVQSFHFSSSSFFFEYVTRCRRFKRLIKVTLSSGKPSVSFEEESDTFLDVRPKHKAIHRWLRDDKLLFASERSGWNHLYLFDARTGLTTAITTGDMVVRGLCRIQDIKIDGLDCFECVVEVSGNFSDGKVDYDPYYIHQLSVTFSDDKVLKVVSLTHKQDYGTHELTWSPSRVHFVDLWSRVDKFPVVQLSSGNSEVMHVMSTGEHLFELLSAERAYQYHYERFSALDRNSNFRIFGIIIRPSYFDENAVYPVIEYIYSGPSDHTVCKPFDWGQNEHQALAELGFIVVVIDGLGTGSRSKKFLDASFQNIMDGGFMDRRAWIGAAATVYPQMDLSRVGIYGTSTGGHNALRALLDHADFYHAAASFCGCHDNRVDKMLWNEDYLGWPVNQSVYDANSNVVQAHRLQGKLLLAVGLMDDNVDPACTMKVADALNKADKDYEMLVIPDGGHFISTSPYCKRRLQDFFVRHLLHCEPNW